MSEENKNLKGLNNTIELPPQLNTPNISDEIVSPDNDRFSPGEVIEGDAEPLIQQQFRSNRILVCHQVYYQRPGQEIEGKPVTFMHWTNSDEQPFIRYTKLQPNVWVEVDLAWLQGHDCLVVIENSSDIPVPVNNQIADKKDGYNPVIELGIYVDGYITYKSEATFSGYRQGSNSTPQVKKTMWDKPEPTLKITPVKEIIHITSIFHGEDYRMNVSKDSKVKFYLRSETPDTRYNIRAYPR